MAANLKSVTPNDGNLYVMTTEEQDDVQIKVHQIRGLCELMLQYTSHENRWQSFALEQDNALLSGVNLIQRLAEEISPVLDKAPCGGGPKADAA